MEISEHHWCEEEETADKRRHFPHGNAPFMPWTPGNAALTPFHPHSPSPPYLPSPSRPAPAHSQRSQLGVPPLYFASLAFDA